jgi:DNA-binding NarL/FixJ family response regulator
MRVFVVESHDIFRRGLCHSLASHDAITEVRSAGSVQEAWTDGGMHDSQLVIVDLGMPGALELVRQLRESTQARVLASAADCTEGTLVSVVAAGAVGILDRDTLSSDTLQAAVQAVAAGTGVLDSRLLGTLLGGITRASRDVLEPRGLSLARLSDREQQVLRLVADGHPTREVARRMRYSERTIKNVIHDVVTKLNVRTRSQAVALAVREGLI